MTTDKDIQVLEEMRNRIVKGDFTDALSNILSDFRDMRDAGRRDDWVKVEDRLPTKASTYWATHISGAVFQAHFNGEEFYDAGHTQDGGGGHYLPAKITAWMPITEPAPFQEGQDA